MKLVRSKQISQNYLRLISYWTLVQYKGTKVENPCTKVLSLEPVEAHYLPSVLLLTGCLYHKLDIVSIIPVFFRNLS